MATSRKKWLEEQIEGQRALVRKYPAEHADWLKEFEILLGHEQELAGLTAKPRSFPAKRSPYTRP